MTLRFEWGGSQLHQWNGLLEISEGSLGRPKSLGVEPDEVGSLWVDRNVIWIQRRSPRAYDGFDVVVNAPRDATLYLTLQTVGDASVQERMSLSLANLLEEEHPTLLGTSGDRLIARRIPGDELHVRFDRPHFIVEPDARIPVTGALRLFPDNQYSTNAKLSWRINKARSNRTVDSGNQSASVVLDGTHPAPLAFELTAPSNEGVYDLHVRLESPELPEVRRRVQFVVYAQNEAIQPLIPLNVVARKQIDQFEPDHPGVFREIGPHGKLHRFPNPFNSLPAILARPHADTPSETGQQATPWRAFYLNVRQPEQPHELIVRLPASAPQSVGISVLEPNAAGQLVPVSLDSGVRIDGSTEEGDEETIEHKLLFWPRTEKPLLLLYGLGQSKAVDIREVTVSEVEWGDADANTLEDRPWDQMRLVGPYLHKPLVPENFGGREVLDAQSSRSVDDWQTFFASGRRMAEYLRVQGYNSLLLAVFAEGSTIYPSEFLEPTPRYDTAVLATQNPDPIRKDVLELYYRVFDREGLVLLPELQFSTPLPRLEDLRRQTDSRTSGLELVGQDGRNWAESNGATQGNGAYYNALHPDVQDAIADVLQELVNRYHHHASYRGVAIELNGLSHLLLPGIEWGYDDTTIARFERQTGIQVPTADGDDRFSVRHYYLTGTARSEWTNWRCSQIAEFHRRLARIVSESDKNASLILAGNRILRSSTAGARLHQAIHDGERLSSLLADFGLDLRHHAGDTSMVILRPYLETSQGDERQQAIDATVNHSAELDAAFNIPTTGSLTYHMPRETRIPGFDEIAPWQPAYTWLVAHPQEIGQRARKQLTAPLASLDTQMMFIGGWTIPLGQEENTRRIRDIIRELPAIPFEPVGERAQPAIIRVGRTDEQTFLYVVNDFSQETTVTCSLSCSARTATRMLGSSGLYGKLRSIGNGRYSLKLSLPPCEVWACCIDDPTVRIDDVRMAVDEAGLALISHQLKGFEQKLASAEAQQKNSKTLLADPGFESASRGALRLTDWKVSDGPLSESPVQVEPNKIRVGNASHWTLDATNPRSGETALLFQSNQAGAVLVSPPLPLEGHSYLSFSIWLRSNAHVAPVQIALAGELNGTPFAESVDVDATRQWQRFVFRVREMPTSGLSHARILVELREPGQLWIDDINLEVQPVSPNDLRQITKTQAALSLAWEEGRYADCERLLQSYWGQFLTDLPVTNAEANASTDPRSARANEKRTQENTSKKSPFWRRLFGRE